MANKCSDADLVRQINRLEPDRIKLIVLAFADCLYGPESDQDWGADTFDALAGLLAANKIGPDF